ncbi:MAG: 16S rRNA methyltransferase [Actinomycetaceae bacterium]|nr:16S rRNA methyltransferase [Actinomycetaceae bacterium]
MSHQRPKNWRPGRSASNPARLVVFDVLMAVETDQAYANLILPREIRHARLNKSDAAFATNLCYGTLRLQGRWDAIIAHCTSGRPVTEIDLPVLVLLRMGAHQLLELQTPPHAAIHETVTIARNELSSGPAGFINAVLRRISERSMDEWKKQLLADAGGDAKSVQFLSSWHSHPAWIVRALTQALHAHGRPTSDIEQLLAADNEPAHVALVARDISLHDLRTDIKRGKMGSQPGYLVDSAVLLTGGDPGRVFAVQDGLAGVQDEGSQLVARTLANAPIDTKDDLWLDLCAGPGGKTATLAAIAADRNVTVRANEIHEHRLDLVADAVYPWADLVQLRLGDGRKLDEQNTYSRVLIDAPCTGIGALRRRPESRWRKQAGDALDLAQLQYELLVAGWEALKPGGVLAYSTCSPYVVETSDVVERFMDAYPHAQRLDTPRIATQESLMELSGVNGELQLWPDLHVSDAMFLALIQKPRENGSSSASDTGE